jgi:hypothetical protein
LEGLELVDVGILRAILSILRPNDIFYGHLVHFVVICIFSTVFGILYREKSGNPGNGVKFGAKKVVDSLVVSSG